MEFILTTGTAATSTLYVVALFKLARPASSTAAVVLVAALSGVLLAFLLNIAQGKPLTAQVAAISVFAGIAAAATAAGARGTDNKADERREQSQ